MYRWWVFVHLVGVFGFLVAHGVSIVVTFRLRKVRDPGRVTELLEASAASIGPFYVSLAVLLTGGIVSGFLGRWWSQAWIWASLGILVATSLAMYLLARPYYRRVGFIARAMTAGSRAVTEEQFDSVLRSRRPLAVAAIGFGAVLSILYLMMFKPTLGLAGGAGGGDTRASCSPGGSRVPVSASNNAFDADCLAAPRSTPFAIVFDNRDPGVPHNLSIYADASAKTSLFTGAIFPGPETRTYEVDALPAGNHYFRCDVHPQMEGAFVVK